jgi:hypothetical protein
MLTGRKRRRNVLAVNEYCQNHSSSNVIVGLRAGSSLGPHGFRAGPAGDQISAILIASDLIVT